MISNRSRRSVLKAVGVASTISLAGCISGGGGSSGPIKIGSALPLSGPLSVVGQEDQRGTKVAKEVLDTEIEIVYRDTETNPSTAIQATKALVEQENVDVLAGIGSSACGMSVLPYIKNEAHIPHTFAHVGTINGREIPKHCTKYAFFPWPSERQQAIPHVDFIRNELSNHVDADTSKLYFIGQDYEAGQTARDVVAELFEEAGGEFLGATMVPQGETDLAPYLSEVENSEAEIISGFMPGAAGIQIINQAHSFGLNKKKVMCLLGDATSQEVLASVGKASEGWFGVHWYDETRDNEMNTKFKDTYTSNWNDLPPNALAVSGFNVIYSAVKGIEEAGSRDSDDIVGALAGMQYKSPMGELSYRKEDHQTRLNCVGYKIANGGQREILTSYPDVIGPVKCNV